MTPLVNTILAGSAAAISSMVCAYIVILTAKPSWVPMLVSYAIGALLGAVFLEILPHALQLGASPSQISTTILVGILVFFLLEKLVLWRHDHDHDHDFSTMGHHPVRASGMVLIGDSFHNLVDGVIIAAAFAADTHLGVVTAVAIISHEIPQEAGDVLVLLHSGMSRRKAFFYNFLSSIATVIGGIIASLALSGFEKTVPYLLGVAASSMIYVAVADLIPGLHRQVDLKASIQQVLLISLGVLSIGMGHWLMDE